MTRTPQTPDPFPDAPPRRSWKDRLLPVRSGVLAGAVFVVGLLVGALAVGLLPDEPVVVVTEDSPEADALNTAPAPSEDASARFLVSGACLGAVNAAQDTLILLDDVGEAAAELDAARLDEIVRGLMPLQNRLQNGLAECQLATEFDPGATPEPSPRSPASPEPTPENSED